MRIGYWFRSPCDDLIGAPCGCQLREGVPGATESGQGICGRYEGCVLRPSSLTSTVEHHRLTVCCSYDRNTGPSGRYHRRFLQRRGQGFGERNGCTCVQAGDRRPGYWHRARTGTSAQCTPSLQTPPNTNCGMQEAPYRTTVMEPLGKMNAIFPVVNEQINKRNKKVRSLTLDLHHIPTHRSSCSCLTTTLHGVN